MMAKVNANVGVNWTGILLGGLVAGLILVGFGILNVTASERDWIPGLASVDRTLLPFSTAFQGSGIRLPLPFLPLNASISAFGIVWELIIGVWTLWLYAAISLRYGQGPKTAAAGGLATWLIIAVVSGSSSIMTGPVMGALPTLGLYLVSILVATVVGSFLYKEAAWAGQSEPFVAAKPKKAAQPAVLKTKIDPAPTAKPPEAVEVVSTPQTPATTPPSGVKPLKPPAPIRTTTPPAAIPPSAVKPSASPPPTSPEVPTAPAGKSPERTIPHAEGVSAVDQQAPPVPPAPPPAQSPAPPSPPPVAENSPPSAVKPEVSPTVPADEPVMQTPPAVPPPPTAPTAAPTVPTAPVPPVAMEAQYQELHETVVALELNIEVAVREVLRIFGKQPLSVDEISQHLSAVNWNFGDLHPRVVTNEALKNLVERGGATEENGKFMFARA
ncbi:MAG: hypothetical protein V3R94_07295 [Acidobacteriota bacterium]